MAIAWREFAQARRQRHQPVALDPRALRQAAPVGLAHAPAVEHHLVAGLPAGVAAGLDRAGEVDAGHHRELAHHRRLAGDGQAVLVVDGGVGDAHRDVAFGQVVFVERLDAGAVAGVVLLDHTSSRLVALTPRWDNNSVPRRIRSARVSA
jgi:hypothetical protein